MADTHTRTKPAHNFKDLTGQTFGRLTVLARAFALEHSQKI